MTLSCQCGRVRIKIESRPEFVNDCNCNLCRKTGALWGYFAPSTVAVEGATSGYCREDKPAPAVEVHFCGRCGATTHFALTEPAIAQFGNVHMGVNMRLADMRDLAGVEIRYPDGFGWSGSGAFGYVRPAELIGG
jgi:hypothetical protein